MFVRLRIMAHTALAQGMADNPDWIASVDSATLSRVINTMSKADGCCAFANELDEVCANAFDEQTAEGFDDLLDLFRRPSGDLRDLLTRYNIKED